MKAIVLFLIRIYQKTLSLDHGWLGEKMPNVRVCIYSPSCSQYTYEAVDKYGVLKGSWMGFLRILRCAPWGKGGFDPVR
jgi:putative membrane protein insertion efficiency factor